MMSWSENIFVNFSSPVLLWTNDRLWEAERNETEVAAAGDNADADVASEITSHIVDFNRFTSIRFATLA